MGSSEQLTSNLIQISLTQSITQLWIVQFVRVQNTRLDDYTPALFSDVSLDEIGI